MSTMSYKHMKFEDIVVRLEGAVAVVTLNRSSEFNTYTKRLSSELIAAFDHFDKDDAVRVVVLTADPKAPAFCAGAALKPGAGGGWDNLWDPEAEKEKDPTLAHRDTGGQVTMAILRCRKLTIVAVNGNAAGIGVTMQLPFDFRIAWADAKLIIPFVSRGICAEAISSYLLPRLVGHSRASSLFLSGDTPFKPTSPYASLLYHEILPTREEVLPAALKFAKHLAETTSMTSTAMTKALMWRGANNPEEQHLLESRAVRSLAVSEDGEEGVRSFFEKRKPKFTGTLTKDMPTWVPWWNEVNVGPRKAKL